MNWKDKDEILIGDHHKVIYNENFVAMPFCVMERYSNVRLASYRSESAARAAVRYHDKKTEKQRAG